MQNHQVLLTVNLYGTSIVLKTDDKTSIQQIIQYFMDLQFIPQNLSPESVIISSNKTNCVIYKYCLNNLVGDIHEDEPNKKNLSFSWDKKMFDQNSQNVTNYSCKSKCVLHLALQYAMNHESQKLASLYERQDISQNLLMMLRDLSERIKFEQTSGESVFHPNYQEKIEQNLKLQGEIKKTNHILSQISENKICIGDLEKEIGNLTYMDGQILESLLTKVNSGIPSTLPGNSYLNQSIEERDEPKKAKQLEQFSDCIYISEMVEYFTKTKLKQINQQILVEKDLTNLKLSQIFSGKHKFVFILQTYNSTFGFFSKRSMQPNSQSNEGFWFSSLGSAYISTEFSHLWKPQMNMLTLFGDFCTIYYHEGAKSIKVKRQTDGMSGETRENKIEKNEKQEVLKSVRILSIDFEND